jgi:predicted DNA-binding protein (MmcQ/YjbR family)
MKSTKGRFESLAEKLRKMALSYPETAEEFPWGHSAFKVKGKSFAFMGTEAEELTVSFKLPVSREFALSFDFSEPTHYGLGKAGWVTVHVRPGMQPPMELLESWFDESYRAIAPKRLVKQLPEKKSPRPQR